MSTQQRQRSPFEDFIRSLRAEETRKLYRYILVKTLEDPDAWLEKGKADRHFIEDTLLDYIAEARAGPKEEQIAGSTVRQRVAIVKSFCDFQEVSFNWKKVRNSLPQGNYAARDRAPTLEELRALLPYCGPRERVLLLMMVSGGFRLGAWTSLKVGDVEPLKGGQARLTVYRGEPEQYYTFISGEAYLAVKEYLAARERIGEKVKPSSPLIRDRWQYETFIPKTRGAHGHWRHPEQGETEKVKVQREFVDPAEARPIDVRSIQSMFLRLWQRAGVRTAGQGRGSFKMVHGLRKFHKTAASKAGLSWEDQEVLLGHYLNYYKPTPEHMEEVYLRLEPFVTVSEAAEAKAALHASDKEHDAEWAKSRLENLELKERLRTQEEKQAKMQETFEKVLEELRAARKAADS